MSDINDIKERLDNIGDVTDISIETMFLGLCALEERQKTVDVFRTTSSSKGSGSKVEKLNERIKEYVGTEGIYKRKGRDFSITRTGVFYRDVIPDLLDHFIELFERIKVERSNSVVIAATQFMTELIFNAYPYLRDILAKSGGGDIEHKLIRSAELEEVIYHRQADLAFGACLSNKDGNPDIPNFMQVNELVREKVGILSNFFVDGEISNESDLLDIFNKRTILLPPSGIVREFANSIIDHNNDIYGTDIKEMNDIWLGLAKMEHSIHANACMFVLEGVLDYNEKIQRLIDKEYLHFNILSPDLYVKSIITGLFRHVEHEDLPENHSFSRIWEIDAQKFLKNKN
jgi:hypothetical protein